MSGILDVFERTEKKYLVADDDFEMFFSAISDCVKPDAYGKTVVSSIYFDTPQSTIINRSLEKPVYKEKLRLRSYGSPEPGKPVFVEIKKKFKGVVYKRRVVCTYEAARKYLSRSMTFEQAANRFPLSDPEAQKGSLSQKSMQISREIDWFLKSYPDIEPAMMVTCQREAFISTEGSAIRFTTDRDIQWRDYDVSFAYGLEGRPLISNEERVMEIKSAGPYPRWLIDALDQARIYPSSFSKYGNAYIASYGDRQVPSRSDNGLGSLSHDPWDKVVFKTPSTRGADPREMPQGRVAVVSDEIAREGVCCA